MRSLSLTTICLLTLAACLQQASAQEYSVDTGHSAVIFGIQHVGLGNTYGRFNDFSGTIDYDPDDPAQGSVTVTVQVASVDSHSKKRDEHLRNADFFDAGTHPTMTFTGTGFQPVDGKDGHYTLTGELTIRGTTKEITVPVHKVGAGTHPFLKVPAIGFEAEFHIPVKEFGIGQGKYADAIGDQARIIVALEAVVKQDEE